MMLQSFNMKYSAVVSFCFLRLLLGIAVSVANPDGFVSIDCGYNGSAYTDSATGLTWTSDSSFFDPTGGSVESSIQVAVHPPSSNSPNYFGSVRYFTGNQTKYCYVFDGDNAGVEQGSAYLVRASFWAGQYANSSPSPGTKRNNASRIFFQMYINADPWDDVVIDVGSLVQTSSPVIKETFLVANYSSEIAVCLGGPGLPGLDSPFISSLELRPLHSQMDAVATMAAMSRHLFKLYRINFGSSSAAPIRYPSDEFDRIWEADTAQPSLTTTATVSSDLSEDPPMEMLQTARITAPGDIGFNATLDIRGNSLIKGSGTRSYYYCLYMAEISPNVTSIGQRVFDITILDSYSYDRSAIDYDIMDHTGNKSFKASGWFNGKTRFQSADAYEKGALIFSFVKSDGAVFGPLLSGLELFLASNTEPSPGTITSDVNAIKAIQASFGGALGSWQGDPCSPYPYNWIACTETKTPAIISLSLANQNLIGEIPPSIANLTSLSMLDLQGNRLNGNIPEVLATLPNLQTLWLQNNNLSGEIPTTLLERRSNGGLQINVDGNPLLCLSRLSSCTQQQIPTSQSKNKTRSLIIGISLGLVGILLVALYMWRKRRQKVKASNVKEHGIVRLEAFGVTTPDPPVVPTPNKPRSFSYLEIEKITNNFSYVLGEGGFGKVFYGFLDDTNPVAVKILSTCSTQGIKEFLNEVDLLSRVHHRNLVQLLGFCVERQVVLIYEYMANGSLENIIHGNAILRIEEIFPDQLTSESVHSALGLPPHNYRLSWRNRLKILVDAAEGVNYLHNGCKPRIIHRDLKPANILIDKDMEAKISDFGISRSNYDTQGRSSNIATTVKGSVAYMAPEYILHGHIDGKIDVYAFGMVILEVISGRSPIDTLANNEIQHIKEWVKPLFEMGKLNEIMDPRMSLEFSFEKASIWKVLRIAMACINENNSLRPQMEEVTQELKRTLRMGTEWGINTSTHLSTFSI